MALAVTASGASLDPRLPVLVGVGQVHHAEPPAPDPVDMLAEAARRAATDAGADGLLGRLDSIRVVNLLSRAYPDPAGLVAGLLGISVRQRVSTTMGGNTPQSLVNRTAAEIAAGHLDVALIGGAESWRTRSWYRARGERPPWRTQPDDARPDETIGAELVLASPEELAVGLAVPVQFYPLFETALAIEAGHPVQDQLAIAASLWADMAAVAAKNPYAAVTTSPSAAEIAAPGPDNRLIGYPYTKLLCSNNSVDQAAAVLLCSLGAARSAGVPEDRMVFVHGGADAADEADVIRRDRLTASPAIRAVGAAVFGLAGVGPDDLDFVDLYSCFPSAVQVARRELGLGDRRQLTVTGGLTFAGGPWNDYVTHAIATMVGRLRAQPGALGLVTANGGHLTKHAAGLYSTVVPAGGPRFAHPQESVDAVPTRAVAADHAGPATLEAFTVVHDRAGAPEAAYAYGLRADGARTVGACRQPDVLDALEGPSLDGLLPVFAGDGTFTLG